VPAAGGSGELRRRLVLPSANAADSAVAPVAANDYHARPQRVGGARAADKDGAQEQQHHDDRKYDPEAATGVSKNVVGLNEPALLRGRANV